MQPSHFKAFAFGLLALPAAFGAGWVGIMTLFVTEPVLRRLGLVPEGGAFAGVIVITAAAFIVVGGIGVPAALAHRVFGGSVHTAAASLGAAVVLGVMWWYFFGSK